MWDGLYYWWKKGWLLRSAEPLYESAEVFKGRRGMRRNTRAYYEYLLAPDGETQVQRNGRKYVSYQKQYLDPRGARELSKAQLILDFLAEHPENAYFSTEIADALAERGVKIRDVMATIRRYERFVYVRGYRTNQRQTPFKEGFLLTWIDQEAPREHAIEVAIQRTDQVLAHRSSRSPVIERIHRVSDQILEASKLKQLVGFPYLQNTLGCTKYELNKAVQRALQLYPNLQEIKLFNVYRYYYHSSFSSEDLHAAKVMQENYIRGVKGRDNRIGHNWEAVPEWFIDTFTTGARFWMQKHRTAYFDPRRITIHLLKPVGGRRRNASIQASSISTCHFSDSYTSSIGI